MTAATLEEVLATHEYALGMKRGSVCTCGFVPDVDPSTLQTQQDYHRAHVATVVRAWLAERLADEGLREAVRDAFLTGLVLVPELGYRYRPADGATAALAAVTAALGVGDEGAT